MLILQPYNVGARKFTPNQSAFQTHLRIPKKLARMFRPTKHVLIYIKSVKAQCCL